MFLYYTFWIEFPHNKKLLDRAPWAVIMGALWNIENMVFENTKLLKMVEVNVRHVLISDFFDFRSSNGTWYWRHMKKSVGTGRRPILRELFNPKFWPWLVVSKLMIAHDEQHKSSISGSRTKPRKFLEYNLFNFCLFLESTSICCH
jgi:hypothetical protein